MTAMEASGTPEEVLLRMRPYAEDPWIDYIGVAPRQYIKLFDTMEQYTPNSKQLL